MLAAAGLTVFALDRRGSGESEGARGDIASYDVWRDDYLAAMAQVRADYPTHSMLMVGQSFGGAIAVAVACDARASHDALLLCSPLLAPKAHAEVWRGVPEDQAVAIPTPDHWFSSRSQYLDFMKRDPLRVNALTPRFHLARVEMARHYLSLSSPLATRPCAMVLARQDRIVDLPTTKDAFEKLSGPSGMVIELPAEDHYLEFATCQRSLWELTIAFAVSRGFTAAGPR